MCVYKLSVYIVHIVLPTCILCYLTTPVYFQTYIALCENSCSYYTLIVPLHFWLDRQLHFVVSVLVLCTMTIKLNLIECNHGLRDRDHFTETKLKPTVRNAGFLNNLRPAVRTQTSAVSDQRSVRPAECQQRSIASDQRSDQWSVRVPQEANFFWTGLFVFLLLLRLGVLLWAFLTQCLPELLKDLPSFILRVLRFSAGFPSRTVPSADVCQKFARCFQQVVSLLGC